MRLLNNPWRHIALPRPRPRFGRWPTAPHMEMYDIRKCKYCGHLVSGWDGQHTAEHYHRELREALEGPPEMQDPGGYVVGTSPLPVEMTGARPSQDDDDDDGEG